MSRYSSLWNKRDKAEPAIVKAIAQLGVIWIEAGPLDGWAYIVSRYIPVEIKSGKDGTLTKGQKKFTEECQREGRPYAIWRSVEEAIEEVNKWRQRA